mgnify:CR=1 FL=1
MANLVTGANVNRAHRIKLLIITFNFNITRREIPAFRGAVIEKAGRENILFHNHMCQNFRYGYPLIQYKVARNHPVIICINEGTEEIHKFFEQLDWTLVLNGKEIETDIRHISFDYFNCGFSAMPMKYKIENWFALNEINFRKFMQLDNRVTRVKFLERTLTGNILSFAKGVGWTIDQRIDISINRLSKQHSLAFKEHQMVGFHVELFSNIILPDLIGLGKSVSRGFGVVRRAI